jgi:hypothetical protein
MSFVQESFSHEGKEPAQNLSTPCDNFALKLALFPT